MTNGRDFVISHLYETFHHRSSWLAEVIKLNVLDADEWWIWSALLNTVKGRFVGDYGCPIYVRISSGLFLKTS